MTRHWQTHTQNKVSDDAGKNEDAKKGQGYDEHVEEAIVSFADAVANPGTVVIETVCGGRRVSISVVIRFLDRHSPTQLSHRLQ